MPNTTTGPAFSSQPSAAVVPVASLFAGDIHRRIEEVIKVDQTKEEILAEEIGEYIATDSICQHFIRILERYQETPNKPHEGIGVWISGFFGSGKSSFAKLLGLALDNRMILGETAAKRIGARTKNAKIQSLLAGINELIPTHAVIFDVATDRGIQSANAHLTGIAYRMLLGSLGYAKDLDLAGLELALEEKGELEAFKTKYKEVYQKDWDEEKNFVAFSLTEASYIMHLLKPVPFTSPDSWQVGAQNREDITPNLLADRAVKMMAKRKPGKSLIFVVDEVGQFVARDNQKMLDLQALAESLGRAGRGKMWLFVTSQEKLDAVVDDFTGARAEFSRMRDRFALEVHLEPSDISEVAGKRVLAKNAAAESALRSEYDRHHGSLEIQTRVEAKVQLPALTPQTFIDLYPLLPYQIRLMIDVVTGLRSQGGTIRHVGGANRTIIKLAQQLLIHPSSNLAAAPLGELARIDAIYDLVRDNIDSEIRQKITDIATSVPHPFAQPVAKAVCLLQFVKTVPRTAENIAAALYPALGADSRLTSVQEALDALEKALMIRRGDDGYRIPTPAEDDWERVRSSFVPKPGEANKIYETALLSFWKPQPVYQHLTRSFHAGLSVRDHERVSGDVSVNVFLTDSQEEFNRCAGEVRKRSQSETKTLFWVVRTGPNMSALVTQIHRSDSILARPHEKSSEILIAEEEKDRAENIRLLRIAMEEALLSGHVFFQGNDRSATEQDKTVPQFVTEKLKSCIPAVYHRFSEAAVNIQESDLIRLFTDQNLNGLPAVYAKLKVLEDHNGMPRFRADSGPLAEVLARIKQRSDYGQQATGAYLASEFAKEPFGWEFDTVRALAACLLRAGKIEVTSRGEIIDSHQAVQAQSTFKNNNFFKQAAFRPKTEEVSTEDVVRASIAFQDVFGQAMPELEAAAAAVAIRQRLEPLEETFREVYNLLLQNSLPGADVIGQALNHAKAIRTGKQSQAVHTFLTSHQQLRDAIARATALRNALTEPALAILAKARQLLNGPWSFLENEGDLAESFRADGANLREYLSRERFYEEIPAIDQAAARLAAEFERRKEAAVADRAKAYTAALTRLQATPGWTSLEPAQQARVQAPLEQRTAAKPVPCPSIPELRADCAACDGRLAEAINEMMRILDGNRVVRLRAGDFFSGGVESAPQLETALKALREECERLIGEGKKIFIA